MLLALALACATPAAARDLRITTWNLDWLTLRPAGDPALPRDQEPRPPGALARLRRYADILDADVVAFEEVDGPQAAAAVFAPDRYAVHVTQDRVVQRVGFAVRRGLAFTANPDDAALRLRPSLRSGADITLATPVPLRLLAVHLKAGCRTQDLAAATPDCITLQRQRDRLREWVAARQAEGVAFLVLGDFNRWMDGSDAFWAGLRAAAALRRATDGRSNPCWGGGGFIDHILAGGAARQWMDPAQLRVLVYRETGPDWREALSDHCPVSVRLHVPD